MGYKKTKIVLSDGGAFADWCEHGCPYDDVNYEAHKRLIDIIWNQQAGIRRQLWQVAKRKSGSVITFDEHEMALAVSSVWGAA